MKQSAIAAQSSVSGDQVPPGPSNSGGGAVLMGGRAGAEITALPMALALADAA